MATSGPVFLSHMEPCLRSICFDSTDWEQLPATSILSILWLKFRDPVNLEDPSKPVYALWRSSVEFVSTVPGFQGLYWAPINQHEVIVLIQWDSGKAWSRFECSLGFSMLLGHLEQVTNRCMQLALPNSLFNASFRLEVVSYDFPASPDVTQSVLEERQSTFKERWNSTFQLDEITDAIYACGEWIEDDYLMEQHFFCYGFRKGLIAEDFKFENHYFAGLVFWNTDLQINASAKIADQFAVLAKEASTVTTFMTQQMRYEGTINSALRKLRASHTSIKPLFGNPLLNIPVTRRWDLDDLSRMDRADRVHLNSVEVSYHDRIVPSPAGFWHAMGSINQYEIPKKCLLEAKDMLLMVSFRLLHNTPRYKSAFGGLRDALWSLSSGWGVRQGTNPKDLDQIYLLAGIGNIKLRTVADQQHLQQEIQQFKAVCAEETCDFSYQQVPGPGKLGRQIANLEILTFNVPDCESDCQSLEYAFNNLHKTTKLQKSYGPPLMSSRIDAASVYGMARETENGQNDHDQQMAKFTVSWTWKSGSSGRDVWYDEFAKRAQNEYENFGHTIEWLRSLCNSSDNIFLVFEIMDSEVGPLEMSYLTSNNLPRPGRSFGGAA